MGRKKFDANFDFDALAQKTVKEAERCGVAESITFKSIFSEFCRIKKLCDRLFDEIENGDVFENAIGSKGQHTYKSNPLIKDYTNAHKTLVSTATSLQKYLDSVKPKDEEDNYAL